MKNGAPLWREAHFQVKMYKTPRARTNFGRSDVQKWHAAVARSTFVSQNVEKLILSCTCWKIRSGSIACRCGAEHICKSKCAKHHTLGPLFAESDVQKLHAAVAPSTFVSQNVEKLKFSCAFLKIRSGKMAN